MFSLIVRFFSIAALLAASLIPGAALAQSTHLDADSSEDPDPADSELGRAQWKRTRARTGVTFSVLVLPMGAGILAAGIIYGFSNRDPADDVSTIGDPRKAKILIPIGTILIAGGLAGMGVSAHGLRAAKREVREIESRPPPTTLHFGPGSVSLSHQF